MAYEAATAVVYAAGDPIEAQAALSILEGAGIAAELRDYSVSPYPMAVGPMTERQIVVSVDDRDAALTLLAEAAAGELLNPENVLDGGGD